MLTRASVWRFLAVCFTVSAAHTQATNSSSLISSTVSATHAQAPNSSSSVRSAVSATHTQAPNSSSSVRSVVSATHTQVTQAPNSSSSLRSVVSATSASPATSIASGSHTVSATSSATPVPATHKKNPKRGIGYAGDVPGDIINANQTNSVISWQYNWANIPPGYLATSNIPYIPMQWGGVGADSFPSDVQAQGATTILTFNEPDFVNEANMQPEDAANIWMQFIQPMKALGIRLGGPAVTASSTGRPWLLSFLAACSNCTIDFLPLHWYGSGVEGFYSYIWDVHTNFPQYPIWITEFADTSGNDTEVADFLNQTITYLDTLDWVERYAWFGYFRPRPNIDYNFLDEDGGLNALGQVYLGAQTVHTEVISSGPTSAYKTVNGADNPTQAPATTWASLSNSASSSWSSIGSGVHVTFAMMTLSSCFFGALWILL